MLNFLSFVNKRDKVFGVCEYTEKMVDFDFRQRRILKTIENIADSYFFFIENGINVQVFEKLLPCEGNQLAPLYFPDFKAVVLLKGSGIKSKGRKKKITDQYKKIGINVIWLSNRKDIRNFYFTSNIVKGLDKCKFCNNYNEDDYFHIELID